MTDAAVPADAMSDAAPPTVSEQELARVCEGRPLCRAMDAQDAGRDAAGTPLRVLRVALFAEPEPGPDGNPPMTPDCGPVEYWALIGQPARSVQKIIATCSESATAVDVGGTVSPNAFRSYGGGDFAWKRSMGSLTVQLSPPMFLEAESSFEDLTAGDDQVYAKDRWSWARFAGNGERRTLPCGPEDEPVEDEAEQEPGDEPVAPTGPAHFHARWASIPQVDLPAAYTSGRWRTTSLGTCALHVDASAPRDGDSDRGFAVHGAPGAVADARLSVVAAPDRSLYVEIRDDRIVTGGSRWILDDHVELWASDRGELSCTGVRGRDPARQWGIRLDGQVIPAHGAPTEPLAVEVARHAGVVRMRIALPPDLDAVTVVYSDSDDGARQERLIATSQLTFGKAWSLGELQRVAPEDMTCEIKSGALAPRARRRFSAKVPMIAE